MIIKTKRTQQNAKMPTKAHTGDFCYDVFATSVEEVRPKVWKYGIGLAFEIVRDETIPEDALLAIDFRPRSSVWKTGLTLCNCVGTIDELYRGEVSAYFYEVADGCRYSVGDRIGQIKLGMTLPIEFVESDINMDTERGIGGFGSTGR